MANTAEYGATWILQNYYNNKNNKRKTSEVKFQDLDLDNAILILLLQD